MGFLKLGMPLVYLWAFLYVPDDTQIIIAPGASHGYETYAHIPVAVNDTFVLPIGCYNDVLTGNFTENDYVKTKSAARVNRVTVSKIGTFSCGPKGNFIYKWDQSFYGKLTILYRLALVKDPSIYSEATITIFVATDSDCDMVADTFDIDDDNDGILDIHEGADTTDTDGDGIPNRLDIDSDNDGITDYTEWQEENSFIEIMLSDNNMDGWDDGFDPVYGGDYYESVDTDLDGTPDFLDTDSDDDRVSDFIEAFNSQNDAFPDVILSGSDCDNDGLDDICDTLDCQSYTRNAIASNSPLPDFNNNGLRDWRDVSNFYVQAREQLARTDHDLFIYPNPVRESCKIDLVHESDDTRFVVRIFNMSGIQLYEKETTTVPFRLNLGNLDNGSYIVQLNNGIQNYSAKIIKTN